MMHMAHTYTHLKVGRGVPVRVEQDQPVASHQIETATAGLARQEEHEFVPALTTQERNISDGWMNG